MNNRFHFAGVLLVLGGLSLVSLPTVSEAQRGNRARVYAKADVDRLIKRVEENSNSFRELYEKSLSKGILPGTEANDDLKAKIQRMDESLERLRSEFNRRNDWRQTKSQVADVFEAARPVNQVLNRRNRIKADFRRQWGRVKTELNTLGAIYQLPRLR